MPIGRRERNKEEKLGRILTAASELFALRGVDDVTTQQVADAADIGTGTLFLYARTKGELLLMVQNAHYAEALAAGVEAADGLTDPIDALMAIVSPIVACNREHVGNGRTYLREMVFGDPAEEHHARALAIVDDTEMQLSQCLMRTSRCDSTLAQSVSRAVSALMLRNLAAPAEISGSTEEIVASIRREVTPLLSLLAIRRQ